MNEYPSDSRHAPHRGSTVLVLGILSLVICAPLGIFAWVMGNGDLAKMRDGTMDPSGAGITNAGRILGIIATVLLLLGIAVWVLMFAGILAGGLVGV